MSPLAALVLALALLSGLASGSSDSGWHPFLSLADRDVAYLTLEGIDPVVDAQSPQPEHILLRVFVAARETNGSTLLIKGSISRESLDREPRWDTDGSSLNYFVCLRHQWRPKLFLRQVLARLRAAGTQTAASQTAACRANASGQVHDHPLLWMDEVEGVPFYFELCPKPNGERDYHENTTPFFFSAHVPASLADSVVEVCVPSS